MPLPTLPTSNAARLLGEALTTSPPDAPANQAPGDAAQHLEVVRISITGATESYLLSLRGQLHHAIADVDQALANRAHRRRLADEVR